MWKINRIPRNDKKAPLATVLTTLKKECSEHPLQLVVSIIAIVVAIYLTSAASSLESTLSREQQKTNLSMKCHINPDSLADYDGYSMYAIAECNIVNIGMYDASIVNVYSVYLLEPDGLPYIPMHDDLHSLNNLLLNKPYLNLENHLPAKLTHSETLTLQVITKIPFDTVSMKKDIYSKLTDTCTSKGQFSEKASVVDACFETITGKSIETVIYGNGAGSGESNLSGVGVRVITSDDTTVPSFVTINGAPATNVDELMGSNKYQADLR